MTVSATGVGYEIQSARDKLRSHREDMPQMLEKSLPKLDVAQKD